MSIAYVDWGGTRFRCGIESVNGLRTYEKPSKGIDAKKELEEIFAAYPDVKKVGVSFAGQTRDNIILSAPNIDAKELDLNAYFTDKTIVVQNDLKCALLAEAEYFKERNISVLYVGTGIGSAYMNDGRLIGGYLNLAGEIGHIPYRDTGEVCGCGKRGCLELSASGIGLETLSKKAGLDSCELLKLYESEEGRKIASDFVDGVGHAASVIITLLNPKLLVVGGGIVKSNEYLLPQIKDYVSKNGFLKSVEACDIKLSQIENGSLEGARLLVL